MVSTKNIIEGNDLTVKKTKKGLTLFLVLTMIIGAFSAFTGAATAASHEDSPGQSMLAAYNILLLSDEPALRAIRESFKETATYKNSAQLMALNENDLDRIIRDDYMVPFLTELRKYLRDKYFNELIPNTNITFEDYYESRYNTKPTEGKKAFMNQGFMDFMIEGTYFLANSNSANLNVELTNGETATLTVQPVIKQILSTWVYQFRQVVIYIGQLDNNGDDGYNHTTIPLDPNDDHSMVNNNDADLQRDPSTVEPGQTTTVFNPDFLALYTRLYGANTRDISLYNLVYSDDWDVLGIWHPQDAEEPPVKRDDKDGIVLKPEPTPSPTPQPTEQPPSRQESPDIKHVPEDLNADEHGAYILGYPEGDVHPDGNITREEVATIINRILKTSAREKYSSTDVSAFSDLVPTRWSAKHIATMSKAGIVQGYPDGTFAPAKPITRAEFITMVMRFDNLTSAAKYTFYDIKGHWAEKAIKDAANRGWVMGYEDGTFKPNEPITRGEVVTLINRILNRKIDAQGLIPGFPRFTDLTVNHWAYFEFIEATISHNYVRRNPGKVVENWVDLNTNIEFIK